MAKNRRGNTSTPTSEHPTPIIPEDVKPTGFGISKEVTNSLDKVFKWYKANGIKVPKLDEKFQKLLSLAPKKDGIQQRPVYRGIDVMGISDVTHEAGSSSYHVLVGNINITEAERLLKSSWHSESILYHEYGHAIHYRRGIIRNNFFDDQMDDGFKSFFEGLRSKGYANGTAKGQAEAFSKLKKKMDGLNKKFLDLHINLIDELEVRPNLNVSEFLEQRIGLKKGSLKGLGMEDVYEMLGSYEDTIQALSRGEIGRGHSVEHISQAFHGEAEFFAHAMENRFLGNPIFEHLDKSLYDEMLKMVDEILEKEGI